VHSLALRTPVLHGLTPKYLVNPDDMSTTDLRKNIRSIYNAALRAVDPQVAIQRYVQRDRNLLIIDGITYDLNRFKRCFVVGAGKASAIMASAIEAIIGDHLKGGLVIVKVGHTMPLQHLELIEAQHPIPDNTGLQGTKNIIKILNHLKEDDLVLCLFSGGGSALMPLPVDGVTLAEKQVVTERLISCGATINEINTIRKHISLVKGGRLAQLASPGHLVSLILSDVIGDPLEVISSGPTVSDETTYFDCRAILDKYKLHETLPASVINHLARGLKGLEDETPTSEDPIFNRTQNVIIANNRQALDAARVEAIKMGYHTLVLSSSIDGETREVAQVYSAIAREIRLHGDPIRAPACIISGGETTVKVKGEGKGGRNQEFVLATVSGIADLEDTVVFSAGTDGTDGPTDAAGAIADGQTKARAADIDLDFDTFLNNNDAYNFFQPLGDLVLTGPTHTNVMDLRLLLVG